MLNVVIFDEDRKRRSRLKKMVQETKPETVVRDFEALDRILAYVGANFSEVAFINMENADGGGFFLTKKLRELSPRTNVIAVSDDCRYAQELMKLRISGYITGKMTKERVMEELENLRYE